MFKKIFSVCAGVVFSSGLALAVDVSGVYSGESNGQNVSITLNSQDGVVRGQVAVGGGGTLPLVGREMNGQIQGIWRNVNGQDVPFAAVAGPDGLQLQTNGMTYSLSRGGSSQGVSPLEPRTGGRFAPATEQADPVAGGNGAATGQLQLQTRQGRVMQADIPAGWSFSDTTNGIDTSAPDGITWVSHIWLRGVGRCNPDLFLQGSIEDVAAMGHH